MVRVMGNWMQKPIAEVFRNSTFADKDGAEFVDLGHTIF